MINKLTAINDNGNELVLNLMNYESNGICLVNVDGLGPPKATINMSNLASGDGGVFNSARTSTRNIVMDMLYSQIYDAEKLRQILYKVFPLKSKVKLFIETDERSAIVEGYVESNNPKIFSNTAGCQISIICPSSYMYSINPRDIQITGVRPNFEFPFENEGMDPMIEFGIIKTDQIEEILYEGDVNTGVIVKITALGPVGDITIYNTTTRITMTIHNDSILNITGSNIDAGDTIELSTIVGDKHLILIRDGKTYNIINSLNKDTEWINLKKGINMFAYRSTYGRQYIDITISNLTTYEGI